MIRNLNQMTFQGFGTVPPERNQSAKYFDKSAAASWNLTNPQSEVFRAAGEVWVTNGSGMSVLSVSRDGENYQDFYLDKPACIHADTYFSLSPFMGEATAIVYAKEPPIPQGSRNRDALHLEHRLKVDRI